MLCEFGNVTEPVHLLLLKCIVISTPFSTVGKLFQSIPFEAMKNQSEMIGKIVGAAIIDELYNHI